MPDSRLKDLAIEALTNLNAKKPSRLARTKDTVALVTSLLALPTALISVIGLLQQTHRADVAQQQKTTVQATADTGLETTRQDVEQLRNALVDLKKAPPQDNTNAIDEAITRANSIGAAVANTQTQLRTASAEQSVLPAAKEWHVVIGDYADLNEARRKQDAAQQVGYSNSEIYGEPPHLHMRFRFSSKEDATFAAEKLKAARISHEPDVVPYRPKG
jgi:hypothetical protein